MEAQVQDVSVLDQIRAFLDQILLWLETITGVFADIDGMLENLLSIAENSEGIIEVLFSIGTFIVDNIGAIFIGLVVIVNCIVAIFTAIVSILTAIITAAGLVGVIIGGIATVIIAVLTYLFTAFPYYRLGKKAGVKCAWLAWMPIPGLDYYCRLYVLSQIPGEKPVTVFGDKFTIPDRFLVFWACIGIRFLGTTLITMLVTVLSPIILLIPVVGEIYLLVAPVAAPIVYMLPTLVVVFLEFAFLYDTLCTFKGKKLSNLIMAIILTLIDNVFTLNLPTMGFATTIYLYTLLGRKPIEVSPAAEDSSAPEEEQEESTSPTAEEQEESPSPTTEEQEEPTTATTEETPVLQETTA